MYDNYMMIKERKIRLDLSKAQTPCISGGGLDFPPPIVILFYFKFKVQFQLYELNVEY